MSVGIYAKGIQWRTPGELILRYKNIWLACGLFILTLGIYFPALEARMVSDDFAIVNRWDINKSIQLLHDTAGFGRNEYRPMIAFSYALSNSIWSGSPKGYHLDNILLHCLNVILLYSWLALLTRSPGISVMAAALFAFHPIHDERVIWITARDSLFSTLFSFLALIAYWQARRKNENASFLSSPKFLICLSTFFYVLSLMSYEGAAVIPFIMAAMEFFLFAQPKQKLWNRLWMALVKTRWHMIILLVYLAFWALLFRGEIGSYDLSFSIGNLFHNCYHYLYHLFHGNSRLAGILYFLLLILAFLMPRERRPVASFMLAFVFISFLPFIFTSGFAGRFAYAGAAGYSALIALLIYGCGVYKKEKPGRSLWSYGRLLIALSIFAILTGYYISSLRSRISDWLTAGQIADAIPRQIKAQYPDLPDGTKLVLARIPGMYGHAYVYPSCLEFSIERFYPGRKLQVIYGPGEMSEILKQAKPENSTNTLYLKYVPESRSVVPVKILESMN
jgi:hypothetical protein